MAMTSEEFKAEIMGAYPLMRGIALSMLKNPDDASDAIQDTAASLWQHVELLEKASNRRAYILTSLRNRCSSHLRTGNPTGNIDEAETLVSNADDINEWEYEDLLAKLLQHLPPTQQKILTLSISRQLDTETIALSTGLSKENVRQIISRARRTLRQLYQSHFNT